MSQLVCNCLRPLPGVIKAPPPAGLVWNALCVLRLTLMVSQKALLKPHSYLLWSVFHLWLFSLFSPPIHVDNITDDLINLAAIQMHDTWRKYNIQSEDN